MSDIELKVIGEKGKLKKEEVDEKEINKIKSKHFVE